VLLSNWLIQTPTAYSGRCIASTGRRDADHSQRSAKVQNSQLPITNWHQLALGKCAHQPTRRRWPTGISRHHVSVGSALAGRRSPLRWQTNRSSATMRGLHAYDRMMPIYRMRSPLKNHSMEHFLILKCDQHNLLSPIIFCFLLVYLKKIFLLTQVVIINKKGSGPLPF